MFEKYYTKLEPRDQHPPRLSDIKLSAAEFAQVHNEDLMEILLFVPLNASAICVSAIGIPSLAQWPQDSLPDLFLILPSPSKFLFHVSVKGIGSNSS